MSKRSNFKDSIANRDSPQTVMLTKVSTPIVTMPNDPRMNRLSVPSDRISGLYQQAILIRVVEERLLQLFSQGRLFGTVHTCLGQEWTGVAVSQALQEGDYVFSNHRCHGHFLARTNDVEGLMAEVMGRRTGVCGGRGGSQHLCREGFFSNGIQGGIMPVSAGLALSHQLRGSDGISVVYIGDGTLGEGAVYETLNCASKWSLPLLIVLENNRYSQSTRQEETLAGEICDRAEAFGIRTDRAATWFPEELVDRARASIDRIRAGGGPVFLQVDTDRLGAHSKGDDDRDPEEIAAYRERDPIERFVAACPEQALAYRTEAEARVDEAVRLAEMAPWAEIESEISRSSPRTEFRWLPAEEFPSERCVIRIRESLRRGMAADDRVVLLGEDIESPYGGAFKVTLGLSSEFKGRVRNCPISESLIVGLGNGLALAGMRPVCEIMFGDFLTLGMDQLINHASKFRMMYNNQLNVPLIVRTPMGGRRGYGPTHSQSLEKHFLGVPDLRVIAINGRLDPALIYDRLLSNSDQPTLVIENKTLYGQRVECVSPDGFVLSWSDEQFPTVGLLPAGTPDVTVVCYGEMLREAEEAALCAFDEYEMVVEVICPSQISPLNQAPIVESVRQSRRLLVVEEGIGASGFGAEVVACVSEVVPGITVRRLAAPSVAIPACAPLERELLPQRTLIVRALQEMLGHE